MKLKKTKQLISFCAAFSLIGAVANAKKPEEQAGYDKAKDLGVKAPDGADTPFDGTMASIKKNLGNVAQERHGHYMENREEPH